MHIMITPNDVAPYMILQVENGDKVSVAIKHWLDVLHKYMNDPCDDAYQMLVKLLDGDGFKKDPIVFHGFQIPEVIKGGMHVGLQAKLIGDIYPVIPHGLVCAHARGEL